MINGISKIKSLRSFGIYENHTNVGCDEFVRFNLIYGWNGSGKSTLSRLFRSIENKSLNSLSYETPSFDIEYSTDGTNVNTLTQANIETNPLNVRTFNNDFIQENIDWSGTVKSILLVDKQKISERKQLDQKKNELKQKREESKSATKTASDLEAEINKFLSDTAKSIKISLKVIGTDDRKYLNYNKTSLEKLITSDPTGVSDTDSVLSEEDIVHHTKSASPVEKPKISLSISPIQTDFFESDFNALKALLQKTAVNEVIDFLKENPDVQTWVSTGISLHEKHESNECHFCGSTLTESRLTSLNNHFSEAFKLLKEEIAQADKYCKSLPEIDLPAVDSFFEEFQAAYKKAIAPLDEIRRKVSDIVKGWEDCLVQKTNDPFDVSMVVVNVPQSLIDEYNNAVESINACVKEHNDKSGNFQAVTATHKQALELHYAAEKVIDFDYDMKKKALKAEQDKAKKVSDEITAINTEVVRLESELSNESIAVDPFNDELAKFLGRTELKLEFDAKEKGYKISRNGTGKLANNLSEGEKTAIAFVYFVTKLKEHDNDIKETIVVVDDPVSSFDSNHLFHSYSFLKKHCENAKQLFVMTHNFSYFKLVRDWVLKKNKFPKGKDPIIKSRAYTIESTCDGVRKSKIVSAGGTLTEYNSEYHYLFSKLYSFKDKANLNLDEVYLCANLSRKLLESFLCFKLPKKRSNFRQLVDDGTRGYSDIKSEDVEKVYRFINKYSHNQEIELEDNADNLLGESPAILNTILDMVKTIDEHHYNEMEAVVTA
ncbi:TPA: AAA family ATPase [Vibrio parahaemolyticus]|uniref:AAA family ATPase n=2 Tax=Vibrio parahaemolyticus TaxID=670 RepID=UPI00111FD226|nr:AAA family ATPase [Vibrio parahaemolyticus]EGQ7838828.1 AAA family ATPase [Vibrio parahaemolyticus]EIV1636874.1 AAA family ATPase [Vibrio parahaemolyticus]MBE3714776.1 AAA family ATPase [Vibrio parahaemolyticus]MCR9832862.1 AAA family ATPase [Vibrio parahaemolyticus]MCR9953517.1 AAA family ATPase [Vibrio parahaemolyticus]